jgi:hypothetical protein
MLPVISANSDEVELATELAMRPHQCSAKGKKWMSRQTSGWAGLAGDAVERPKKLAEARRSSPRTEAEEMERSERVEVASEASTRCVTTCGCRGS